MGRPDKAEDGNLVIGFSGPAIALAGPGMKKIPGLRRLS
jgi:hypothetical protein